MGDRRTQYDSPRQSDVATQRDLANSIQARQRSATGSPRTTQSINRGPTNNATVYSVSDILQGTMAVRGPEDTLMVINNALTKDLEGLYGNFGGSISSFSSADPNPILEYGLDGVSEGGGSGGGGTWGDFVDVIGSVKEEVVRALPLEHPETGAFIWRREGTASREMHLPTSGDINVDKQNHKQLSSLPDSWKHPYNLDRNDSEGKPFGADPYVDSRGYVKRWEGGETIIGNSGDTIGNEDPDVGGTNGAYGGYYPGGFMSPEAEQWYCSMAWPCDVVKQKFHPYPEVAAKCDGVKHKDYYGRKIMVYSKETHKAVICTPGDWGPNPENTAGAIESIRDSIIGLSPDTHHALGTDHGAEVILAMMPDDTPLGPYQSETGIMRPGGDYPDTSGVSPVTIEELKYAGNIIADHPNFWMNKPGHNWASGIDQVLRSGGYGGMGFGARLDLLPFREGSVGFFYPSLLNYFYYLIEEGGFILDEYLGSIGFKPKGSKVGNEPSNHSYGGAIDFSKIGRASENKVYHVSNSECRAKVGDSLFEFLASLPKSIWADEHGCEWVADYSNGMHTYRDPAHIHLGFNPGNTGSLLSALKNNTGRR